MNADHADSADDADGREEQLAHLMAEYDEALASDTPAVLDESVVELDAQLTAQWQQAKTCLELLDRARRCINPPPPGDHQVDSGQTPEKPPQAHRRQIGRFEIERELGQGGLGVVYLAHDPKLGRRVAVKVPRFDAVAGTAVRRRFLREAEAAARLSHPHLVSLHEVGEDGPICYLASEYCAGPTLAEWLRDRTRPVPARHAAAIMLKLAEAVQHAHGRGVLHRDIKPSNVLLDPTAVGEAEESVSAS